MMNTQMLLIPSVVSAPYKVVLTPVMFVCL